MLFLNLSKYFQKNSFGRLYVVTLVFLTFASALFWLDYFRVYQTETSVLFVTNQEQEVAEVTHSMGAVMKTLTFAERVERDFPEVVVFPEGVSKDEKKNFWNTQLTVATKEQGGILTFAQKAENQEEAMQKTVATLKTLFVATNLYYSNSNEVEVRVIDKPATKVVVGSIFTYLGVSFLTALFATTLFFFLLLSLKVFGKDSVKPVGGFENSHIGEAVPWIGAEKFVAVRPSTLSYQEEQENEIEVAPVRQAKKGAAAPGNLPIMAGSLPQFGILETPEMLDDAVILPEIEVIETPLPEPVEEYVVDEITEEQVSDGERAGATVAEAHERVEIQKDPEAEPTVEEYKRRLNELLKGNSPT
ncbi:MAG: hypothetical protein KIH67_002030 [Candidatus Moranbacteria bacterium]|nr:hypothetical protein [Candidatus Moranbacteria bacterium]